MSDRVRIVLACELCSARNYKKDKKRGAKPGERLALKKYCAACKKHTMHRETR